jgi:SLT domain-containing protein
LSAPTSNTSSALSADVTQALRIAMDKEGVPNTWENGLQFIVGHESSGQVGVSNTHDSARGLFQLTRANYGLNPNGSQSFGNAVEEAQGGIRYIRRQYQTADNAVQFWRQHRYY